MIKSEVKHTSRDFEMKTNLRVILELTLFKIDDSANAKINFTEKNLIRIGLSLI